MSDTPAGYMALLDATDGVLRDLVNLHQPQRRECQGCDFDGWEGEPPLWPCRTVELIAEHYGIDLTTNRKSPQ